MNDPCILSKIAIFELSSLGTTRGTKADFLLYAPNASADTDYLGPFYYFLANYSGKIST